MGESEGKRAEAEQPDVELPWLDEPMPISEAVETLAYATQDDAEALEAQLDDVRERVAALENAGELTCPNCGSDEDVLKAGVAAARLADQGALSENNVDALNQYSHLCLSCRNAFTPHESDS